MDQAKGWLSSRPDFVRLVAALLLGTPDAVAACSRSAFPSAGFPGVVQFIGTAGADTVAAGAGPVVYTTGGGHFGQGAERVIYGQMIRVHQLGRGSTPAIQAALNDESVEVVLVPWDYAADCRLVPWSRSARWVPVGTRGLFWAVLRDSAYWIGGRPTLDVHAPQFVPYPSAPGLERLLKRSSQGPGGRDSLLTPEELLTLYDVMPTYPRRPDSAYAAVKPLQSWVREHPDLARRAPAHELIARALSAAEAARVRAIRSPLAGTYWFTVGLPSGDTAVLFARTEVHATTPLWSVSGRYPDQSVDSIPRAAGYWLLAQVALSLEALPDARARSAPHFLAQGYLTVVETPLSATDDSVVWRGSVDLLRVAAALTDDGRLRAQLQTAERALSEMVRAGEITYASGRFVRHRDGGMRFDDVIHRGGAEVVAIRGERLSVKHLAER